MRGKNVLQARIQEFSSRGGGPTFQKFWQAKKKPGLEIHACQLPKCELKFSFASWKYRHSKKVASLIFHLIPNPDLGLKDVKSCFSKSTVKAVEKSKRLVIQTRCLAMWRQWRGELWTKFQHQETIAISHRNFKNCSKTGKSNCELDTAICELKLKPLAKVCEWLKK